jgi:hypothetical protein
MIFSQHLPQSEFPSASLTLTASLKVKELFAQPMSGKFMRRHFSEKSECFRKVTKPGGDSAKDILSEHTSWACSLLTLGKRSGKREGEGKTPKRL